MSPRLAMTIALFAAGACSSSPTRTTDLTSSSAASTGAASSSASAGSTSATSTSATSTSSGASCPPPCAPAPPAKEAPCDVTCDTSYCNYQINGASVIEQCTVFGWVDGNHEPSACLSYAASAPCDADPACVWVVPCATMQGTPPPGPRCIPIRAKNGLCDQVNCAGTGNPCTSITANPLAPGSGDCGSASASLSYCGPP